MNTNKLLVTLSLLLLTCGLAQTADLIFTYQGHLKNGSTGANGLYDFQFNLFKTNSNGNSLVGYFTNSVPVTNGLFSVRIVFTNTFLDGSPRFIEVGVGTHSANNPQFGEVPAAVQFVPLLPRQEVTAAPHATYALSAGRVGDPSNVGTGVAYAIAGGTNNLAFASYSSIGGGIANRNSGLAATISGGTNNSVTGYASTISGGAGQINTGNYAVIGGGLHNTNHGYISTIGGGIDNTCSGASVAATIGGGTLNNNGGDTATIGGGYSNFATNRYSTIGGGIFNTGSGFGSTVPGGDNNTAAGAYTFAAGRRARAAHDGALVWGDSTDAEIASTANNQFIARASGGVKFFSNSGATVGVQLAAGGTGWSAISDQNAKEKFRPTDARETLEKVAALSVQTWNMKTQDPAIRHIGPMAQDFYAAFHVGEDDKHINSVDADGVALAAIQGLHSLLKEKDAQLQTQAGQIKELLDRLSAVEKALASLNVK